MLFNSFTFILGFLPLTLLVYFGLQRWRLTVAARAWLLAASLVFYCWWNPRYLPLILGSILFNYTVGGLLADYPATGRARISKQSLFWVGLAGNLLLLGWFKYLDFGLATVNAFCGSQLPLLQIVLPLGISFFTITQIAFLVDAYEGLVAERNLLNYALFVTFFPHLLAGPILHHKEMMPQFDRLRNKVLSWRNIACGLALFAFGLFKKVVLADSFAPWATAGFDGGGTLSFFPAWLASLAYTLQLYFDFSGYSDMAVGIGWLFNIRLPVNFNSPYRATSLIDFWKRWHISLTNFITTYLYTPILRSFRQVTFGRSLVAVFLAMLISGIWHGAGWTFVIWGALHGVGLVVNHVWRRRKWPLPAWLGWLLTFGFVNVSFVFFRAKTVSGALGMLAGMAGLHGVELHTSLAKVAWLRRLGVSFGPWLAGINGNDRTWIMVLAGLVMAATLRNSMALVQRLRPTPAWLALLLLCFCWSLLSMSRVSEFLYFQF